MKYEFTTITIAQLYQLWGDNGNLMRVKHKGILKEVKNIERLPSSYVVKLKVTNRIDYILQPEDTIDIEINHTRFTLKSLQKTFGSSIKIKFKGWALGHYATFIDSSHILDSVKGKRNFYDLVSTAFLFDEEVDKRIQQELADRKIKFINNPISNMTCGFELETQSTEGITEDSIIEDLMETLVDDKMKLGPAECGRWIRDGILGNAEWNDAVRIASQSDWNQWLVSKGIVTWDDVVKKEFIHRNTLNDIRIYYSDCIGEEVDCDTLMDRVSINWDLPSNVEVVGDESVSGFEFRTKGPQTFDEFESAISDVFNLGHDINTRCSFHIHIKVDNINHSYNRAQRQHMMIYLFKNAHRLPDRVRERWANHNANYFFLPDSGDEKMNFINFHDRLGTIEFRCFGNITNKDDAMTCLNLAIESMVDYYKSNNSLLFIEGYDWGTTVRKVMETNDVYQLDKFAKAHEEHIAIARQNREVIIEVEKSLKLLDNKSFNFIIGA